MEHQSEEVNMHTLNAKQTQTGISENLVRETDWTVVRIDGKDYVIDSITSANDGVIGDHVVLHAVPISTVL